MRSRGGDFPGTPSNPVLVHGREAEGVPGEQSGVGLRRAAEVIAPGSVDAHPAVWLGGGGARLVAFWEAKLDNGKPRVAVLGLAEPHCLLA